MSPLKVETTPAGTTYGNPIRGPADYTRTVTIDPDTLSTDEIDAHGYVKPGTPLKEGGGLADGTASEHIEGVVVEATKVADSNAAADLTAADPVDVAVLTIGQVNRAIIEDNLGRTLTGNEVAAFAAAGCLLKLIE